MLVQIYKNSTKTGGKRDQRDDGHDWKKLCFRRCKSWFQKFWPIRGKGGGGGLELIGPMPIKNSKKRIGREEKLKIKYLGFKIIDGVNRRDEFPHKRKKTKRIL